MLRLSAPRHVTFFISIAVAVIAVIIHYAKIDIPHVHSGFVILLIGYLVLVAGNVLDGVLVGRGGPSQSLITFRCGAPV